LFNSDAANVQFADVSEVLEITSKEMKEVASNSIHVFVPNLVDTSSSTHVPASCSSMAYCLMTQLTLNPFTTSFTLLSRQDAALKTVELFFIAVDPDSLTASGTRTCQAVTET